MRGGMEESGEQKIKELLISVKELVKRFSSH